MRQWEVKMYQWQKRQVEVTLCEVKGHVFKTVQM